MGMGMTRVVGVVLVAGALLGACGGGGDGDGDGAGTSGERTRLGGLIVDKMGTDDGSDDVGLSGVVVVVTDADGEEVAEGTTPANGVWQVDVPGPGTYTATLDVETLPDGVGVEDDTVEVEIVDGQASQPVSFDINEP